MVQTISAGNRTSPSEEEALLARFLRYVARDVESQWYFDPAAPLR